MLPEEILILLFIGSTQQGLIYLTSHLLNADGCSYKSMQYYQKSYARPNPELLYPDTVLQATVSECFIILFLSL